MKKSNKFDDLSEVECMTKGCSNKIKQRLIDKKNQEGVNRKFKYCYQCWKPMESNRRSIGTKR